MFVHVTEVKPGRIDDPGGRLVFDYCRCWKEASFGSDLQPGWTLRADGGVRSREDVRIILSLGQQVPIKCNLGRTDYDAFTIQVSAGSIRITYIHLQIKKAVIGRIEYA